MKIVFYVLSLGFAILGMFLVVVQWIGFWFGHIKKRKVGSLMPFFPGIIVAVAFILFPNNTVKKFFWIGFVIDWTYIAGLYLLWKNYRSKKQEISKQDTKK